MRASIRGADESGSGSILVAIWMTVLVVVASGVALLASLLNLRVQVAAAADLAALAAAGATLSEPASACGRAREVAMANGARLGSCQVDGTEAWVVAEAAATHRVTSVLGRGVPTLRARAHAELVPGGPSLSGESARDQGQS
ncbi:MAG: Rv3654c family TadE-like protein [Candidatus Nanopelagicales bacterium]